MPRDGKCHHGAAVLLALIVGALTLTCTSRAIQTTVSPNAAIFGYSLAAGANSGAFTPVANQSVLVMGTQTALGFRGVGQVAMLRVPGAFLEWVGLNSTSGASIAQGFSGSAGTHIVYLDFSHQVDIQVATPDSFLVHNASSGVRTGNVTVIW